jgi:hypothetical protein
MGVLSGKIVVADRIEEIFLGQPDIFFDKKDYFFHPNVGNIGFKRSGSSSNTDNFFELEKSLPFSLLYVILILISSTGFSSGYS